MIKVLLKVEILCTHNKGIDYDYDYFDTRVISLSIFYNILTNLK